MNKGNAFSVPDILKKECSRSKHLTVYGWQSYKVYKVKDKITGNQFDLNRYQIKKHVLTMK